MRKITIQKVRRPSDIREKNNSEPKEINQKATKTKNTK